MTLRLFALRDLSTNKTIPGIFFPSRPEARTERDARNGKDTPQEVQRVCITLGPDHRRFEPASKTGA